MSSVATNRVTNRGVAPGRGGLGQAISDGWLVTWRNLKRIPRIPELAIFAILQSIMFVLLFAFVFGGAIPIPGYEGNPGAYREFLMPGIFAQTIVFASGTTAIGMTADVAQGIMDRFRSLPMARSAVLTGRAVSDIAYNAMILVVLVISGLAVGWTVHTGIGNFLAGMALLLLFTFAMSWLGIWMGLNVPTVEVAQQVIFTLLFPITFISNVFVPPQTLPDWLQPVAEWNPTSTLTAALRELWGNPNPFATDSFPGQEPVLVTLGWVVVIIAIFGPLGVRKYRSISR
jgi:ABC transporter DrrB family efflux protein